MQVVARQLRSVASTVANVCDYLEVGERQPDLIDTGDWGGKAVGRFRKSGTKLVASARRAVVARLTSDGVVNDRGKEPDEGDAAVGERRTRRIMNAKAPVAILECSEAPATRTLA